MDTGIVFRLDLLWTLENKHVFSSTNWNLCLQTEVIAIDIPEVYHGDATKVQCRVIKTLLSENQGFRVESTNKFKNLVVKKFGEAPIKHHPTTATEADPNNNKDPSSRLGSPKNNQIFRVL